jgi:hypothetical protein
MVFECLQGITQSPGDSRRQAITQIDLSADRTSAVRGDPTPLETTNKSLSVKTFKTQPFMPDCFHKGTLANSLLSSQYSMLGGILMLVQGLS